MHTPITSPSGPGRLVGICRAALGDYGAFGVSPRRLDHAGLGCTLKSSSLRRGGEEGRTGVPITLLGLVKGGGGGAQSVRVSVHSSICPVNPASNPATHPLSVQPSFPLSVQPLNHPSAHPAVHPSIHRSIYQSICLSIHPASYPSTHQSVRPSIHPSIHLSNQPFIHLPVSLSFHPSLPRGEQGRSILPKPHPW